MIEILSAYVRHNSPRTADSVEPEDDRPVKRAVDIVAAVTVLGRRQSRPDQVPIDLRASDLERVDLTGLDFAQADLTEADLTEANLNGADLTEANLNGPRRRPLVTSAGPESEVRWLRFSAGGG